MATSLLDHATSYAFAAPVLPDYVRDSLDYRAEIAPAPFFGEGWVVIITDDPGTLGKLQLMGISTKPLSVPGGRID